MIFEINNLSFSYNTKKEILKNIDLEINDGDLITFLGKNGSGKTTLFNLLLGLNKKYDGTIKLNNKDLKNLKEKDIASICGFVPQTHTPTFGFTVLDFILLGLANKISIFSSPSKKDKECAIKLMKELDIYELKDRDYSELSGGEMQQVTIARALISQPKLIIFDEPTSHLDFANTIKILKTIKELNKKGYTILMSTHDPNQPLLLNSKVVLFNNQGNLLKGTADEIITEKNLKETFNCDISIRYNKEFKCKQCIYSIK